jgi:hypothetical protein
MSYNKIRTAKMRQKSDGELRKFVEAKSLSSACAASELARRGASLMKHERDNPELVT